MTGWNHQAACRSASSKSKVLCIEDDPIVQLMLEDIVTGAGAEYIIVGTAREAEDQIAEGQFDLVLLDRRLPDSDGLLLLQSIKSRNDCPVWILSAMDETRDKLLGIGLGAAEYVTKPFNPIELSSRIRQLLGTISDVNNPADSNAFEVEGMTFDPRSRRLDMDGHLVILAPAEARLLHVLLLNEGEVQTRDQLSQFACGREWSPGDRTVDVLINRLRGRMRSFPVEIVTVHRTGYLLVLGAKANP
ncbi:response regulator transcription factor [Ruegeria hyattellae]|uniref:response regulator transcription factor n=1 Tax=Ruegeria hyattellae TaxID=3233337 RepID=UPI00355C0E7E